MKFKYSSLLVSGLVLATFATSTVNADEANNVVNGGQLKITKNFDLRSGVLSPKADFAFTVSSVTPSPGEEKDGLTVFSGITTGLKESKVSYDNNSTTNNKTKTTTVDFSGVNYPKPGIYRYTIKENAGSVPGVSYDTKGYTVDVYVLADDENGHITYKPRYIVSHDSTKTAKEPVVFNNEFKTTSLKVSKKVTGNAGDRNKEFTFSINLNDVADNKTYELGNVEMTITKKDGSSSKIQVPVTNKPTAFTLKDGESATIDKLPIGIHYSVGETQVDGYKQSATINKDTSKSTTTEYSLGDDELSSGTAAEIIVTNTKDSTTPTGVSMTIVPYVGLTIIALGGVLYVLKKRKA
ncbi:QVPTGV class sortase B protein-sorting domain-containing protein [Enterococcus faecium]|uniref:DUF7601 domain-containing protein n=1 Tax=Enterococcus faecium TaxID=1352 RepID=A0A242BG57_ENTFC|nr:QVPTGV class sortase B protein-sorting domain-containing protein [Enterococcus faecium]OTN86663.1 hypothetical protein A5810_002988 [Enterococcus faecium]OTN86676.1 hypothetical protein A5810_002965 [Enterococcus faecium]OTN94484.1 hypothetical protein A5810_000727 [Enterococcus faecium]